MIVYPALKDYTNLKGKRLNYKLSLLIINFTSNIILFTTLYNYFRFFEC